MFIPILVLGCAQLETPYLYVYVKDEYTQRQVEIPYQYRSEDEQQKCRIIVKSQGDSESETVYEEETWMKREGTLDFELDNGFYTLQFTVLTKRGGRFYELSFLDKEYEFSVSYSD